MKSLYACLLSLLTLFAASSTLQANTVIVKGYVTTTTGAAVANKAVRISSDSSSTSIACYQEHIKYTNVSGYYADTLTCTSNITKLRIIVANCDGSAIVHDPAVPASNVVESNFVVCVSPPTNCLASYFYTRLPGSLTISYNSSASLGINTSDTIIRRLWRFGDNDSLVGNVVSPTHTFNTPGTYNTCVTIFTASGCQSVSCMSIYVFDSTPPPVVCHSDFSIIRTTSNYKLVKFNSSIASAAPGDNIVSRTWKFGDGDTLGGNVIDPQHTYTKDSTYTVCLKIKTAGGCESQVCKQIEVRAPHCFSRFTFTPAVATASGFPVNFSSAASTAPAGDSIQERIWKFGDGSVQTGNIVFPSHTYTTAGVYNVCLIIRTNGGCSDTMCTSIQVPLAGQVFCHADYSYVPTANSVKFQSNISTTSPSDSIISRTWSFGDSTALTGNVVDPTHAYAHPGLYNVCLTIKTRTGCENRICKQVSVTSAATNCVPQFTYERIAPKKVRFNSLMSWTPVNDSIISRTWNFGDGSALLTGNVAGPVKEYLNLGVYTVCLKIKTVKGCESQFCNTVNVQDSVSAPAATEAVKIISLYPTPTTVQANTVVWSLHNNITAELAIYDIYGMKKWSINKMLLQGNNYTVVPTSFLVSGPYFFRVTTMYGVKSRQFYKL